MTDTHWVARLKEFYAKHSLPIDDRSQENLHSHLALLVEEVGELAQAVNKRKIHKHVAQELADVLYVTIGMAVSAGIEIEDTFNVIHRRNMAKKVTKLGSFNE